VAGDSIDRDAIRQMALGDDHLAIGGVGIHRVNATAAHLEEE